MLNRCRCPNNGLFIVAIILLVVFLLVELVLRVYNLYYHEPLVDVPSHFFAGLAIGAGALWVWSLTKIRRQHLATALLTLAVALFWELLETLQELVVKNPPYLQDIFFWDGFFDVIITMAGGIAAITFVALVRRTTDMLD